MFQSWVQSNEGYINTQKLYWSSLCIKRLLILSNTAAALAAWSFSITMETAFGFATEITS